MTNQEGYPGGQNPNEFGFEWVDEDELSPEDRQLLDELSVPVGRPKPRFTQVVHADLAAEVQKRFESLRVESYREVDKSLIKNTPELQMTPHILDDVHYVVYRRRKQEPFNRYVSVSADDIFAEFSRMRETGVNGVLLQRKQNSQAVKVLINDGKIDEGSIYEVMRTSEGRFAVRSLHRFLAEDCMRPFTNILPKAARRRTDERPLMLDEVANRAIHFLQNKTRQHASIDTTKLSTDQRLTYELVSRDLGRASALVSPVAEYTLRDIESEPTS